eukprot:TRINITY_DN19939_c0_g1_i1.p1 TRINITY_DN19939_c0_g1~~TRINITY_DN19939_c0_g1_i1.p1  ORF type:complete len:316 (+),score=83.72 TRINITY_DN19939_c0_g1_i1:2-949(+)
MASYNQHLDTVHQKIKERNDVAVELEKRSEMTASSTKEEAGQRANRQNQLITQTQEEFDRHLEGVRKSVSDCEERNEMKANLEKEQTERSSNYIKSTNNVLQEIKTMSMNFSQRQNEVMEKSRNTMKSHREEILSRVVEDKENVLSNISKSMDDRNGKFESTKVDVRSMQTHVDGIKSDMDGKVRSTEEETLQFVKDGLKKDTPTGTTPLPKQRSYPRTLAATSPHKNIIKRFNEEQSLSEAADLPLDRSQDADSIISRSTRPASSLEPCNSGRSSRSDSLTDLASECDSEVFKVPTTGLKKPEVFYKKKNQVSN